MRAKGDTLRDDPWAPVLAAATLLAATSAHAELSAEEQAKLAQNPVANLISRPFQNNTNLNTGADQRMQNILNIQPVIPVSVNDDWNIITRTVVPVVSQPQANGERSDGIGDTVFAAFLSPAKPGQFIWGVGPVLQLPSNSNADLGNKNWGLGPSVVALHLEKSAPWVYGALISNIWSLSEKQQGGSYNNGMLQPFVNLQPRRRSLPDFRADHHRQLESRRQPTVDRAPGRRYRQDLPFRQAAGQHRVVGVLQRRRPRQRGQLADPRTGAVDVSQVAARRPG